MKIKIKQAVLSGSIALAVATLFVMVSSNGQQANAKTPEQQTSERKAQAQENLRLAHTHLSGKEIDSKKALRLLQSAAFNNLADAQFELGSFYDPVIRWYFISESDESRLKLLKEAGLKQDAPKAKALYEKAAEQGNSEAMIALGVMYIDGSTIDRDIVKARNLFNQACDIDNELGCTILSTIQ